MKTYRKTAHPTHKGGVQGWTETETSDTLNAFDITELRMPILVLNKVDMQQTTGTLSSGAHPGSYNGQDAYNDMFVVDDGGCLGNKSQRYANESQQEYCGGVGEYGSQRPADNFEGGV